MLGAIISALIIITTCPFTATASVQALVTTEDTYVQAPVTADMINAASLIISTLLPTGITPGSVTNQNSVAWQRLAYVTDTFGPRFSGSVAWRLCWIG